MLKQEHIGRFIKEYPEFGKKHCMKEFSLTEPMVRHYAGKYNLKSNFKFNPVSNYNRGSRFRGIKRPEHSLKIKELRKQGVYKNLYSDSTNKKMSDTMKRLYKEGKISVDRFRNHKHSPESKEKCRIGSINMWKRMTKEMKNERIMKLLKTASSNGTLIKPRHNSTWKQKWYEVGGKRFFSRSSWECNYADILENRKSLGSIKDWEHEPETFWFEKIRTGTRCYIPDFKITNNDGSIEYHEIKGWMDAKSRTKINRMRIYHPEIKLRVIEGKEYKEIIRRGI